MDADTFVPVKPCQYWMGVAVIWHFIHDCGESFMASLSEITHSSFGWYKDFSVGSRYWGHRKVITSHSILWDVITFLCPQYLLPTLKSTYVVPQPTGIYNPMPTTPHTMLWWPACPWTCNVSVRLMTPELQAEMGWENSSVKQWKQNWWSDVFVLETDHVFIGCKYWTY